MRKSIWTIVSIVALLAVLLSGCSTPLEVSSRTIEISTVQTAADEIRQALADGKIVKSVLPIPTGGNRGWVVRFTDETSLHFLDGKTAETIQYMARGSDSCWYASCDFGETYHLADGFSSIQQRRHPIIQSIEEDNLAHRLTITLANDTAYILPKSSNAFLGFEILQADNPGQVPMDLRFIMGTNRLVIIAPHIADKTQIVARFSTEPDNKVFVWEQEQTSGETVNDFTDGVGYQIVSPTGEINNYTVSIQSTGLPLVSINTPDGRGIPDKMQPWMENAELTVYQSDGSIDCSDEQLKVRIRGNSTRGKPKRPYALKLSHKSQVLGMPEHKRWVLLANWQDRTLLRNEFAFEIARQTGLVWTPRGEFVDLVVNGRYLGNYYLCEQVRVGKSRLNIKEMTAADTTGSALTGGYLVELDENFDEVYKFHSAIRQLPYMFKNPDEDVLQPAQFCYFQDYVNELEARLYASDWLENRSYADYLDLTSFADWWLAVELTTNREPKGPKSCYMYKDRLGRLTAGPVWDFDYGTFRPEIAQDFLLKNSLYYDRLFDDPVFVAIVRDRWQQLAPAFRSVPDNIRKRAQAIRRSERLNHQLWPITEVVNGDESLSFDDALERMIEAYQMKLAFLDSNL